MLNQDNKFYLRSWSILIIYPVDNVRILWGDVSCWSRLGVKGLKLNRLMFSVYYKWISTLNNVNLYSNQHSKPLFSPSFLAVCRKIMSTTFCTSLSLPNSPGKCFCTSFDATSYTLELRDGSSSYWNQNTVSFTVVPFHSKLIGKLIAEKETIKYLFSNGLMFIS